MKHVFVCGLFLLVSHIISAQTVFDLYNGKAPGIKPVQNNEIVKDGIAFKVIHPSLTAFMPNKDKATGAAVVICPGGGYGALMMEKEGYATARYFQQYGVAAFVLKYRLPDDSAMVDKTTAPLQDAQQGILLVKQHAKEWNIDTARIGIMGFSAGGHLAATAATHFATSLVDNPAHLGVRPAFALLVYPVISMNDSLGHRGSRDNLLGKNPSAANIQLYSNELQVTDDTPPSFLLHAADDKVVDVDNSIAFFEALRHHKVPAEMHIYPKGDHGFILNWPIEDWMSLCMKWMEKSGFIK